MTSVQNTLPKWARPKVSAFLNDHRSPIRDGKRAPLSSHDNEVYTQIIHSEADRYIAQDNSEQDRDKRVGHVEISVLGTELTERYSFRKTSNSVELAYSFADGHQALYLRADENGADMVDVQKNGYHHDLAVHVDQKDPSQGFVITAG